MHLYVEEGQLGLMDARRDTAVMPCGLKVDITCGVGRVSVYTPVVIIVVAVIAVLFFVLLCIRATAACDGLAVSSILAVAGAASAGAIGICRSSRARSLHEMDINQDAGGITRRARACRGSDYRSRTAGTRPGQKARSSASLDDNGEETR